MKLSIPDFKNLNYKQLLVDHAEKLVVGVVALFAIMVLSGSRWSVIDKTPNELNVGVSKAREVVEQREWPDKERNKYKAKERIEIKIRTMNNPVLASIYLPTQTLLPSIFRVKEKITKDSLAFLPLVNGRATASKICLLQVPVRGKSTGPKPTTEQLADTSIGSEDDPLDEFSETPGAAPRRRKAKAKGFGGRGRREREQYSAEDKQNQKDYERKLRKRNRKKGRRRNREDGDRRRRSRSAGTDGRGKRFVAVRFVFPMQRQIELIADAFHEEMASAVIDRVEIFDFELQKQTLLPGPKWSNWEPVDVSVAKEVLRGALDPDPDLLDYSVLDPTIVMPLPPRARGRWGRLASHPDLSKFQLTERQVEREREWYTKLIEQKRKEDEEKVKQSELKKGGFNDIQYDVRSLLRKKLQTAEGRENVEALVKVTDQKELDKKMDEDIMRRAENDGSLLLFRYFDFEIEPGSAYRYRVRLIMKNPTFGLPIGEVADHSLIEGRRRKTPWSEPTELVFVPEDTSFYITEVRPTVRNRPEVTASIVIYQWYEATGTVISSIIKHKIGQFIGGPKLTPLLNTSEETFVDTKVVFDTGYMLVDAAGRVPLNRKDHPDVDLSKTRRGELNLNDELLVVNSFGELKTIDTMSLRANRARDAKRLQAERARYNDILESTRAREQADKEDAILDAKLDAGRYGKKSKKGEKDSQFRKRMRSKGDPSRKRSRRRRGGR